MGGGASIPLSVGDSLIKPGNPSVLSDPITIPYDAFLAEIVTFLKYPVMPQFETVLKDVKLVEVSGPDDFEVTVTLDPVKLKSFGFENKDRPELARINAFNKVKVNRAERTIETENYAERWEGEEEKLAVKTVSCFTKEEPFRLDYHWILPDGTRKADADVIAAMQPILDSIAASLADRKVKLTIDEGKKCYVTGAIDEGVATYDKFFDAIIAAIKEGAAAMGSTVEEMTETKFKIVPPGEAIPYNLVTVEKEKGTISYDTFSTDGTKKLYATTYTFAKSPLSLEVSCEEEGGVKAVGPGMQKFLQGVIDGAVAKCGSSGWLGGLLG